MCFDHYFKKLSTAVAVVDVCEKKLLLIKFIVYDANAKKEISFRVRLNVIIEIHRHSSILSLQ